MAHLALVRHGESIWNEKGLWTGWTDIKLNKKGLLEAREAAKLLKDIPFDQAFTSSLIRADETLEQMELALKYESLPETATTALDERDYGDLTGKNKWDVEKEFGEEQFQAWRRGWDTRPPNGESLKDVYQRVIPYYEKTILPLLEEGKNVLVVAHGNSLRALVKYLDNLTDTQVEDLSIATGEIYLYDINPKGKVESKTILGHRENTV